MKNEAIPIKDRFDLLTQAQSKEIRSLIDDFMAKKEQAKSDLIKMDTAEGNPKNTEIKGDGFITKESPSPKSDLNVRINNGAYRQHSMIRPNEPSIWQGDLKNDYTQIVKNIASDGNIALRLDPSADVLAIVKDFSQPIKTPIFTSKISVDKMLNHLADKADGERRLEYINLVKPTLENPLFLTQETINGAQRFRFFKTFIDEKDKVIKFLNVVEDKNGELLEITATPIKNTDLKNLLKGKIVWGGDALSDLSSPRTAKRGSEADATIISQKGNLINEKAKNSTLPNGVSGIGDNGKLGKIGIQKDYDSEYLKLNHATYSSKADKENKRLLRRNEKSHLVGSPTPTQLTLGEATEPTADGAKALLDENSKDAGIIQTFIQPGSKSNSELGLPNEIIPKQTQELDKTFKNQKDKNTKTINAGPHIASGLLGGTANGADENGNVSP